MPQIHLVGIAALIVIAVGLLLLWYHRRRAANGRENHIRLMQETLGIKPGSGADSKGGVQKPATALMLYDHGLRVNGPWLNEIIYFTGDPAPFHGTKQTVRDAQSRARGHYDKSVSARKQQNWELAEQHLDLAFEELNRGMLRDHWFAAELFYQQGMIRYEQGNYGEARESWERAEMVCHEWPTMARNLLPTLEANLKLVRDMLGF